MKSQLNLVVLGHVLPFGDLFHGDQLSVQRLQLRALHLLSSQAFHQA